MLRDDHSRNFAPHASRLAYFVVISCLLATMVACGKKGPVRPKLASQPQAPTELTLQQQGNLFILGWTIPSQNDDGSQVEDLKGFRILRLSYDAAEACPTCRDPHEQVAELDLDYPAPGQRIGQRIYWRDTAILPGSGYRYAVVPLSVGNMTASAASIHLAAQEPPAEPSALQALAGDRQVQLSWTAPALSPGSQLVGYNLYRRTAQRPFPIVPVNAEPLKEPQLTDRGLDNDQAYEYRVSAVVERDGLRLESKPTPGVLIAPRAGT